MRIDTEVMATPRTMALWTSSIEAWEAPYESDRLTPSDRARIAENIPRAFHANGDELHVIDDHFGPVG